MIRMQSDVRFDELKQALARVDKGAAAGPTKRNKPMEIPMGQAKSFDVAEQRTSNQLVQLIRKLRWIGRDDEAERVLEHLTRCRFRPTETVIAGPWATD
jgi:hypothetical protein